MQITRFDEQRHMNLRAHSELDSLFKPAAASPAPRLSAGRALAVKSLVKVCVISISIILLIGNSG